MGNLVFSSTETYGDIILNSMHGNSIYKVPFMFEFFYRCLQNRVVCTRGRLSRSFFFAAKV